jgi:hypothetical protein
VGSGWDSGGCEGCAVDVRTYVDGKNGSNTSEEEERAGDAMQWIERESIRWMVVGCGVWCYVEENGRTHLPHHGIKQKSARIVGLLNMG